MSPLLLLAGSIAFLLILIIFLKINAFLALILTAVVTGLAGGMPPKTLLQALETGAGSTLGSLVLVLAFGVMLGSILGETGAADAIARKLVGAFGPRHAGLALALTGFVVGIALFYNAGFVVLAPLAFSVARSSGQPLAPLAIAMAAPLSVTHGFLPPHPGAANIAKMFGADAGKTLLLGLCVALPAVLAAGVLFPRFLKKIPADPPPGLFPEKDLDPAGLPGFARSFLIALLPVLLMSAGAFAAWYWPEENAWRRWLGFAGDPAVALLLSVGLALVFLAKNRWLNSRPNALPVGELMEKSAASLGAAASLLLVIGAGGVFKQVLIDSGIGQSLADAMRDAPVSPLLLGWTVATFLRIAVGSATVAGTTAAGIVQPLIAGSAVSPELLTLAVGAGSLMCSHVNDTGFWMFREWFGLSLRDTFRSWTAMETIVGVVGLLGVLVLDTLI